MWGASLFQDTKVSSGAAPICTQTGPILLSLGAPTFLWSLLPSTGHYPTSLSIFSIRFTLGRGMNIFSSGSIHSLPGISRELLRFIFVSFFFHSTLNLVLNNYTSCHEYVCEWIVQNSKMSCKKILLYCNVHDLT